MVTHFLPYSAEVYVDFIIFICWVLGILLSWTIMHSHILNCNFITITHLLIGFKSMQLIHENIKVNCGDIIMWTNSDKISYSQLILFVP
jgi:hypothetical protein